MRFWKPKPVVGTPQIGMGVATFLEGKDRERRLCSLLCLLWAFKAQTWQNWRIVVVHDGPLSEGTKLAIQATDPRIEVQTPPHVGQFGHPHRQATVEALATNCEWFGLTNDDNYYVPSYFEWMLSQGTNSKGCEFVYCDMVHSHRMWKAMTTVPRRGKLDLGGWIARTSLASGVKFDNHTFAGDGDYINRLSDRAKRKNPHGVQKVAACLFVHN